MVTARCADTRENNGLFKTSAVIEGGRGEEIWRWGEIKKEVDWD